MPTLLVVDDERNVLYSIERIFRPEGVTVLTAQSAGGVGDSREAAARRRAPRRAPWDMSGLEVFDRIRQIDPRLPVIIITAFAATETAIEAMKRGAFEYLLKPVDFHQLREVVAAGPGVEPLPPRARRVRRPRRRRRPRPTDRIVGRSRGHAGGVQGHRPGGPARRDRADHRARAAPARSWWPAPCTTTAAGPTSRSWPSTAPPSRRRCWRASCSATSRAPSPGPTGAASASSSRPTGGTLFLDEIGDMSRRHPGQGAARPAGAALRAAGRQRDHPDRRAPDRRHQQGPGDGGGRRPVPRATCSTG